MKKFFQDTAKAIQNNKKLLKKSFWLVLGVVYLVVFIKLFLLRK